MGLWLVNFWIQLCACWAGALSVRIRPVVEVKEVLEDRQIALSKLDAQEELVDWLHFFRKQSNLELRA